VTYPAYFLTQEYFELNVGYYYSTLMIHDLYAEVLSEINRFASHY
jgi:hypothetical protein